MIRCSPPLPERRVSTFQVKLSYEERKQRVAEKKAALKAAKEEDDE